MSAVTIRNVEFLNNPARFTDAYRFRVTFECISPLKDGMPLFTFAVSSSADFLSWMATQLVLAKILNGS